MNILPVTDPSFRRFGQVLEGYDFRQLLQVLAETSPKPAGGVVYVPSDPQLEALPVARDLQNRGFGGIPIQIGYCNGTNKTLNCLEYHRNSELIVAADDIILLLAHQADLEDYTLDTGKVEAFRVPAGTGVELYATSLHYAPCSAGEGQGFRAIITLARGTNLEKPAGLTGAGEDRLCLASNKWLIAHPDAPEAAQGAFVGLTGKNIEIF